MLSEIEACSQQAVVPTPAGFCDCSEIVNQINDLRVFASSNSETHRERNHYTFIVIPCHAQGAFLPLSAVAVISWLLMCLTCVPSTQAVDCSMQRECIWEISALEYCISSDIDVSFLRRGLSTSAKYSYTHTPSGLFGIPRVRST